MSFGFEGRVEEEAVVGARARGEKDGGETASSEPVMDLVVVDGMVGKY